MLDESHRDTRIVGLIESVNPEQRSLPGVSSYPGFEFAARSLEVDPSKVPVWAPRCRIVPELVERGHPRPHESALPDARLTVHPCERHVASPPSIESLEILLPTCPMLRLLG